MSSLTALPTELLVLIFEHVGGRELRRSQTGRPPSQGSGWRATDKLTLCQVWYVAARPVYLSGLHVSELRLYACNLDSLKGELGYSGSRSLMHKNTRSLTLKLLGHFWDTRFAEDMERWHAEDAWCGPFSANEYPADINHETPEDKLALVHWRGNFVRPCLEELFLDLGHFSALKYLDITASSDPHAKGPDWNYLYQSTVLRLLRNLPLTHSLRTFVLDTAGTRLVDDDGQVHICEEIARVLPRIENVRLRMISICPCIYNIPQNHQYVALKTLIIKLYLPFGFRHTPTAECEPCMQIRASLSPHDHLIVQMCRAAPVLLRRLAGPRLRSSGVGHAVRPGHASGMTGFILSYRERLTGRQQAWNCLEGRRIGYLEDLTAVGPDNNDWHEFTAKNNARARSYAQSREM